MKQICFGLRLQNVSQGLRLIWDSLRTPTGNINGDQIIFSCLLTESNCNFCNVQSHKVLLYQKPEHRVTLTLTIHLLNIEPPMFLMAPLETSKPRRFIRTYMALCERCATVLNIMAFPFSQFTEQQVPSYAPYVIDRFELKKVFCSMLPMLGRTGMRLFYRPAGLIAVRLRRVLIRMCGSNWADYTSGGWIWQPARWVQNCYSRMTIAIFLEFRTTWLAIKIVLFIFDD